MGPRDRRLNCTFLMARWTSVLNPCRFGARQLVDSQFLIATTFVFIGARCGCQAAHTMDVPQRPFRRFESIGRPRKTSPPGISSCHQYNPLGNITGFRSSQALHFTGPVDLAGRLPSWAPSRPRPLRVLTCGDLASPSIAASWPGKREPRVVKEAEQVEKLCERCQDLRFSRIARRHGRNRSRVRTSLNSDRGRTKLKGRRDHPYDEIPATQLT
jgi:hypothetical protein